MPIRSLIPGPACDTIGGLPALACPAVEPSHLNAQFSAQWNGEMAPEEARPVLAFGVLFSAVSGFALPADVMTWEYAPALPGVPPVIPTEDDIPWVWTQLATGDDPEFFGFMVPLEAVGTVFLATPSWFRFIATDARGCTSTLLVYFPEGLPDTSDVDLPVVVFVQGQQFDLVVPATPDGDEGEPVYTSVDWVTECPAPQQAVAVLPACGAMPVDVVVEPTVLGVRIFRYAPSDDLNPYVVAPGARSVTIDVIEAAGPTSPTLEINGDAGGGAHALPEGYSVTFRADRPGESLPQMTITPDAAGGDVVMISETFETS